MSSPQTLAFGLMIGRNASPSVRATLPPASGEATEVLTANGIRVLVSEPSGINILATAYYDDFGWGLIAESGDIVGDEAKYSLFMQILSTFRFPSPDFAPPSPSASPDQNGRSLRASREVASAESRVVHGADVSARSSASSGLNRRPGSTGGCWRCS